MVIEENLRISEVVTRNRWREMSPEERQRIRDRIISKFGLDEPA